MDESYYDLLETIAQADIAPQIRSLMLRGADEGANGTHHWDITPLLQAQVIFSQLETFSIQLNQPGDHNRSIVGKDYSENGDLANLLARSPNLQELTVPSAPSAAFFEVGKHPLRYLMYRCWIRHTKFYLRQLRSFYRFILRNYAVWNGANIMRRT